MMTAETGAPGIESTGQRRWVPRVALLSLLAVILVIVLRGDLRALAALAWREMLSIPPRYLVLIVTFKVLQALLASLSWRNALNATWPQADLSYRFVVGVDQGQDTVNAVAPGRAGTWAMLAVLKVTIPGARAPKLLMVWAVQNLAFLLFASVSHTLVAVGIPQQPSDRRGASDRIAGVASAQPLWTAAIVGVIVILIVVTIIFGRNRIDNARQQALEGLAILRTPSRYLRLMFLPALASYLFRCAACMMLLTAFGIPITIWTLSLALSSQALSGAVRVTPGGLGTTQAIDVAALSAYAAPEVITAYSLSEFAVTAVVNTTVAITALVSVNTRHGNRALLNQLRRGEFAAGLDSLGERQRVLRSRARQRRRRS
jgi:hypothetical protein